MTNIICIQDLTWVNGEILALHAHGPQDYYIERWVERMEGWDGFLLVQANFNLLLLFLEGKTSLNELLSLTTHKKYLKLIKGDKINFEVLKHKTIPAVFMPKKSFYLSNSSDFLDDDIYEKVRKLKPSGICGLIEAILWFASTEQIELPKS